MRLAHISWKKAEEYFNVNDTVLIGIGSIESHGTHIALGTDTLIPSKLLAMIEDRIDVLIAPMVPYGSCDHLLDFPGTVSIGEEVLYMVLKKVVESLKKHGARKFIFLNGHGGNVGTIKKICLELSDEGNLGTIINWWLLAAKINPVWKGGHGGAQETSAMMAIDEGLVDLDDVKEIDFKDINDNLKQIGFYEVDFKGIGMDIPRRIKHVTDNGWIGPDHPSKASVKWGEEMLNATADYIVEYVNEFRLIKL